MARQGFTVRQQKFIDVYSGNGVEAARIAGYTGSYAALGVIASKMLKNTRIKEAIASRQTVKAESTIASREHRQRFWSDVMNKEEVCMRDRLRASELLGKSEGDFIDVVQQSGPNGGPQVITYIPDNGRAAKE